MKSILHWSAALALAFAPPCFADEDFCGAIAAKELIVESISHGMNGKRTALKVSVPLRAGHAKFHHLMVTLGEGAGQVMFKLSMEKDAARAHGTIYLPESYGVVALDATYHQASCFKTLQGWFANGQRVPEPTTVE